MTLLSRTKEMAKLRGLSLEDVALKAGLSAKAIYNWGRNSPKAENLDKVADVLHVSTDYLLGRTDEMNPSSLEESEIEPSNVEITGMFRRYSKDNALTAQERRELVEDIESYMAMRAKKLADKRG